MKLRFFLITKFLNLDEKHLNAILSVKGWKPLLSHLLRVVSIVVNGLTSNWARTTVVLINRIYKVQKAQGLPGVVKYLKVASVALQQHLGGHVEKDLTSLGPRVARTKSGIPRVIPYNVRRLIKGGSVPATKWALTIFSVYRVIIYPGKLKLTTITQPYKGRPNANALLTPYLPKFLDLFDLGPKSVTLKSLGAPKPFAISRSSPNSASSLGLTKEVESSTHPSSIYHSSLALLRYPIVRDAMLTLVSLMPRSPGFHQIWDAALEDIQSVYRTLLVTRNPLFGRSTSSMGLPSAITPRNDAFEVELVKAWGITEVRAMHIGKLGFKQEPAGKIRVFAMVDCYTQ